MGVSIHFYLVGHRCPANDGKARISALSFALDMIINYRLAAARTFKETGVIGYVRAPSRRFEQTTAGLNASRTDGAALSCVITERRDEQ